MDYEQLAQESAMYPWLDSGSMSDFNSDPDLLEFMADRQHDINEAMREASEEDLKQLQQLQENFHDQTTMDTSRT